MYAAAKRRKDNRLAAAEMLAKLATKVNRAMGTLERHEGERWAKLSAVLEEISQGGDELDLARVRELAKRVDMALDTDTSGETGLEELFDIALDAPVKTGLEKSFGAI